MNLKYTAVLCGVNTDPLRDGAREPAAALFVGSRPLVGYDVDKCEDLLNHASRFDNQCSGTNTCRMTLHCAPIDVPGFDPTAGRFIAQDRRPTELRDVEPSELSPLMRALLVIDGTVTKILEAYFMEPVKVRRLSQSIEALRESDFWLEAAAGETIVARSVALVGQASGRLYTFAESRIMLERLDPRMQQGLKDELLGLGRILLDSNVEVRRECMWYGFEQLSGLPAPLAESCGMDFVSRAYRVIAGRQPLMQITERFPTDVAY